MTISLHKTYQIQSYAYKRPGKRACKRYAVTKDNALAATFATRTDATEWIKYETMREERAQSTIGMASIKEVTL